MEKYIESLSSTILFKNIDINEIKKLVGDLNYRLANYKKDETIAFEGDDCPNLGVILAGKIEIQKTFPSGKIVTINTFSEGNIFGEAIVFSGSHKYPATVVASNDSNIMYIDKSQVIKLMNTDERVLSNFVSVLSNRILMLNERITNLSFDTIRKKIAHTLLNEYKKQDSKYLILPFCRKKMAETLNIPRPSLSRELIKMKDEEIIDYHKNKVKILNLELLEESLLN